ncbi:MAG: cobalamin biosynthesis protein [bacterium]
MRVAGFGFRSSARLASLQAALTLAGGRVDAVATVASKAAGLQPLADALNLPLIAVTQAALAAHDRPGSDTVRAHYHTGSVAESAALAAAGPGAILIIQRTASPDGKAVAAIAEGPA